MGIITGKFHQNPLKTVGGVAETRLTAEKLLKGLNSGKNQSSMTSIKYAYLQVMRRQDCVYGRMDRLSDRQMDGRMEGRTDDWRDEPITVVPFDLRRGRQGLLLIKCLKLTKGHNSGKKRSSVTSVLCISSGHVKNDWKVSSKSLENCRRSCRDKTYC